MKIVDLFSGCGGFSCGAASAGCDVILAIDIDPILTYSYTYNFDGTTVVNEDIRKLTGEDIVSAAGGHIDGICGGPPCQAFSYIGKKDPNDPRREHIFHFFRVVREVGPSFFVMENVPGLGSVHGQRVLDHALTLVKAEYQILGPVIWNAAEFGAATTRYRLFIMGVHKDCGDPLRIGAFDRLKRPEATVRAAISDLQFAREIGSRDGFDTWRITKRGRPFEYARGLRSHNGQFTGHRLTHHSQRVSDRFKDIAEGERDPVGRHARLAWSGQCPALRAGTGPDRGSFQAVRPIHPEHPRVITVREAARLQGFRDCHRFHTTIWHSFRMIGNSVNPMVARAIFQVFRGATV